MKLSRGLRRPSLSLRAVGAAAALAVVLVGLGPVAAHAEGELAGGPTPATAVALRGPVTGADFRVTNVGLESSGQTKSGWSYVDIAWYSYTPATDGVLGLRAVADGLYDITLEMWDPSGTLLADSGFYPFEGVYSRAGFSGVPVTADQTYVIGVGGYQPPVASDWSNNGTATLSLALVPELPTPPLMIGAVPGPESLTVSWAPPTEPNGALTGYVVRYREYPAGPWQQVEVAPTETSTVLTGLTGGQEYAVRVRALNAAGPSGDSDRALATPLITPVIAFATSPTPPTNRDDFDVTVTVTRNGAPARGQITVQIGAAGPRTFRLGLDGVHTYAAAGRRAGTYPVTITYHGSPDGMVVPSTVTTEIVVPKDTYPLTFELGGPYVYGQETTLSATTDSGVPVQYTSSTPEVCTVSGTTLRFVGAGVDACTVTATQPETDEIATAAVTDTATVNRAAQTITLAPVPALTFGQPGVPVTATAGSGDPVVLAASGDCTLTDGVLVATGAGTCTVTADEDGNARYLPAAQVSATVAVAKRAQALSVSTLPPVVQGVVAVPVTVTSSVGLPVVLEASGACVRDDAGVRTVATGSCTLRATQAGDDDTLAASGEWTFGVVAGPVSLQVRLRGAVGDPVSGLAGLVTGTGLKPGAAVSLTVYSAPMVLGVATVAPNGSGTMVQGLPAGLAEGAHRLVATAVALDGTTVEHVLAFGVAADGTLAWVGTAPPPTPALARTGADPLGAGVLAALWVLVGTGLLLSRSVLLRRRRTA